MIKFSQPRYIVPLIILPFIYVFFYLFRYTAATEEVVPQISLKETASVNAALPDPIPDEEDLMDKFDAFQQAYKNNRNYSAIREIDRREEKTGDPSPLDAEIKHDDLEVDQLPANTPSVPTARSRSYSLPVQSEQSEYDKQMQLFKAQMNYMDSLFTSEEESGDGEKGDTLDNKKKVNGQWSLDHNAAIPHRQMKALPLIVKKNNNIQSTHFNTVMNEQTGFFIKAIIDEEIKVKKDSRIRIRLLEDVTIGANQISKGQYLYGIVSSFGTQRIEVHISSIRLDDQILEISLDIYDLDGLKGLYVPESQFRELAKDMGSNMSSGRQLNIDAPAENQMQLMFDLAKDAFNTTTQTVSKSLRKNKARLKYNTMVYLVNSKSSEELQTL
jgi:hypothetical protein